MGEGGWFLVDDRGIRARDSGVMLYGEFRGQVPIVPNTQAQRPRRAARPLHGGGKVEAGSRGRDARSGSLQRLVRLLCGGFAGRWSWAQAAGFSLRLGLRVGVIGSAVGLLSAPLPRSKRDSGVKFLRLVLREVNHGRTWLVPRR